MKTSRRVLRFLGYLCVLLCSGCIDIYVETIPEENPGSQSTADLAGLDVQDLEQENDADSLLPDTENEPLQSADLEDIRGGEKRIFRLRI
jgi:hypothetical protein